MERFTAIVLAGGSGKRMNSDVHKQYLLLHEKPILYYSLKAFEDSPVDSVVLVTGEGEEEYCRKEIIVPFGITKVNAIVSGGRERYHSVFEGLKAAGETDYVLIHDGARPFIDQQIIARSMDGVRRYQACVAGMPVKDTIKILDADYFAAETPERSRVWQMQTPQTFSYPLIYAAYAQMLKKEDNRITDDAMVLEYITGRKAKVIEGSYWNIKITTPEDLIIAKAYMEEKKIEEK